MSKPTLGLSTGVGSTPPPPPKFVDSGTGEYSVHEPIRVLKPEKARKEMNAIHATSTAEFKPVQTKKSFSTSTSTSSSPLPNKKFGEFDSRSSRGTSPPPQTISTQVIKITVIIYIHDILEM
jgi:hypothetical protein